MEDKPQECEEFFGPIYNDDDEPDERDVSAFAKDE